MADGKDKEKHLIHTSPL